MVPVVVLGMGMTTLPDSLEPLSTNFASCHLRSFAREVSALRSSIARVRRFMTYPPVHPTRPTVASHVTEHRENRELAVTTFGDHSLLLPCTMTRVAIPQRPLICRK